MRVVRLGVGVTLSVALVTASWAQARPQQPLQFAPDEVSRPDGGAPPSESPAPQEDDREAAPITRDQAKPAAPAPKPEAVAPPPAPPPPTPASTEKRRPAVKPQPRSAPPPSEAAPPVAPPHVTLHVWAPEKANLFAPEEAIESAMDEVLASDPRLHFRTLETLLTPPDAVDKALVDADNALADAKQAYADMDLDKAKAALETALKGYQKNLPALATRADSITPMRDGFILLANVRFFEGNQDGARDAMRYVFALDGSVKWNTKMFPPQMKKLVVEARLLYETLGTGRLIIDSDPPGASVWLNGIKLPDRTPSQPVDAPNGPNFISYARRGYAPMTQAFVVNGGGEESHALASLSRYPHNPIAPIDRARSKIDETPQPPSLKEACAQLGVDMLVLVKTSRPGERDDEQPQILTAYLYDARPARVINRVEMKVEGDLPATARVLAQELFHGVRLDGVWSPPKAPERPKWYQRLWVETKQDWGRFRGWKGFWYVVGGVAGAVVIGTVVGATVSHQHSVAADTILLGGN